MIKTFLPLIIASLFLTACNSSITGSKKVVDFSEETEDPAVSIIPTEFADKLANSKINLTSTKKLNEEFKVKFKTYDPSGEGYAEFKARSIKPLDSIEGVAADPGKKLYLVEISIRGYAQNKGQPSSFNQIGDTPSPQFVMIDKSKNMSYVEETFFSDTYTVANDLFELSKITLDGEQWVNTAIVFQLDSSLSPDLALRFTNLDGAAEFYDIAQ